MTFSTNGVNAGACSFVEHREWDIPDSAPSMTRDLKLLTVRDAICLPRPREEGLFRRPTQWSIAECDNTPDGQGLQDAGLAM
jgi:hypothetical protein